MPGKLQTGHKSYVFMVTCANRHSTKVQKYDQESLGVWVRNYVSRSFLMKKKNGMSVVRKYYDLLFSFYSSRL